MNYKRKAETEYERQLEEMLHALTITHNKTVSKLASFKARIEKLQARNAFLEGKCAGFAARLGEIHNPLNLDEYYPELFDRHPIRDQ